MADNPVLVTIGHTSIDTIEVGRRAKKQLGGAAVYSAMAAKIFSSAGIVSRVGSDFPPSFLKILSQARINTAGIRRMKGRSTSFAIAYDERGRAHYKGFKLNSGRSISEKDIPLSFHTAKGFHIAPMNPGKQQRIMEYLRENTYAVVSVNTYQGYVKQHRKRLLKLMAGADIFSVNDDEAMMLTEARSFEHALKRLRKHEHNLVLVTMGVYGCIVLENGEINFFPSVFQEKVVDLTGCGDSFAGSFLASYLKTSNPHKAANIANSVASLNATAWNFEALRPLEFKSLERFQLYITSHQRRLKKKQRMLEAFYG